MENLPENHNILEVHINVNDDTSISSNSFLNNTRSTGTITDDLRQSSQSENYLDDSDNTGNTTANLRDNSTTSRSVEEIIPNMYNGYLDNIHGENVHENVIQNYNNEYDLNNDSEDVNLNSFYSNSQHTIDTEYSGQQSNSDFSNIDVSDGGSSSSSSSDNNSYTDETIHDNENDVQPLYKSLLKMLENDDANETISVNIIVSKIEVLLAILKFSTTYSLPNSAVADLCKMFNYFFDAPILPDTRYLIDKLFYPGEGIKYHAVCPKCHNYIAKFNRRKRSLKCNVCENIVHLKDPLYHDFFVSLNINNQLKHFIESHQSYYTKIMDKTCEDNQTLSDIYDGQMYKEFTESLPENKKKSYVTLVFNSDGSPVFKNSKFSIWPIQVNPNEIPPSVRTKKPVTYGLWFGHDKPNMSIFLNPFVKNMNELGDTGIQCRINNEVKTSYVYALCCCVDSTARPAKQGFTQFNGYFGCNWCLHPGELVLHDIKEVVKYPLLHDVPPRRSEQITLRHLQEALNTDSVVYGVKKVTPLVKLKKFNIIDGFVPDSMHCIALGVVRQFLNYWFSTSNNLYSISKADRIRIDNYLKHLKVPTQVARLSRPIADRRFWNSRELENWLLYYSLPVLKYIHGFERFHQHWAILVNAFHLLMQDDITTNDLIRADVFMKQFMAQTEFLYGKDAMTFNVHQAGMHLVQSVANWGPLWAHSGYPFESGNGQIVNNVHAAKGVISQVCRNLSVTESLIIMEKHISEKEESPVIDYCYYLENRCTKETIKIENNRYFGKRGHVPIEYIISLNLSQNHTQSFQKLIKNECVFKSCNNKLSKRSNNSFVQIDNGEYKQVVEFIVDIENNLEYTLCKKIEIENSISDVNMHVKRIVRISNEIEAIETRRLKKLCVFMTIKHEQYICAVPHMYWYS